MTVPVLLKAGLSFGILDKSAEKGCSSLVISFVPVRVLIVTDTISSLKEPSSFAFFALSNDLIAK